MEVAIRTDGSKTLGNGHVVRMLALAEELANRGIQVFFIVKFDDFWLQAIGSRFEVIHLAEQNLEALINVLKNKHVTHLVYDTRSDLSRKDLLVIKKDANIRLIVIDSPEDTRLSADINIYPPITQVNEWKWDGFVGENFSGWEYTLLRREFLSRSNVKNRDNKTILLSFGSTDPFNCTERVLQAICESGNWHTEYEFLLVCGPQFDRLESIKQSVAYNTLNTCLYQSPPDIAGIFSSVSFAVIAFGVTAYELAAVGTPALYLSISPDHEKSARVFCDNGLGWSIGGYDTFSGSFSSIIESFLKDESSPLNNSKGFDLNTSICNWDKIINAIT